MELDCDDRAKEIRDCLSLATQFFGTDRKKRPILPSANVPKANNFFFATTAQLKCVFVS